MGKVVFVLGLWLFLEVAFFVFLGNTIGFLWALLMLLFLGMLGMRFSRAMSISYNLYATYLMELMHGKIEPEASYPNISPLMQKRFLKFTDEERVKYCDKYVRLSRVYGVALMLFLIPGLISDMVAILWILLGIFGLLGPIFVWVVSNMPQGRIFKMSSGGVWGKSWGSFSSNSSAEDMYGKSTREQEKEQESQDADSPYPVYRQEKEGVSKMKEKFQNERVIKDVKFEDIGNDSASSDASQEKNKQ